MTTETQTFLCTACGVELKLTVADHNAVLVRSCHSPEGYVCSKGRSISRSDRRNPSE